MTLLDSVILGVVEGITEFLPVSSTGHLILASSLLGIEQTEFVKSFEIAIQFGAILSVVALYWKSFLDIDVLKRLAAAFLPTALIGLMMYKFIKTHLIGNESVVLWALAVGGGALILFELLHHEDEHASNDVKNMTYLQSFLVGVFQAIAVIPGVSRSAATIVGGLLLGVKRVAIVEFSFLLAVPTMLAATVFDLFETAFLFTSQEFVTLGVGFVISFIVALLSIVWLLRFVKTHTFIPFGIYRIAVSLAFLMLIVS